MASTLLLVLFHLASPAILVADAASGREATIPAFEQLQDAVPVTTLEVVPEPGGLRELAQSGPALEAYPSRCDDPFEPAGIIPQGPYAGRRIDTDRIRSIRALTREEEAPFRRKFGETLAANFQHEGRWWVARIPAEPVQEVIFQSEDIPGGRGHGQIRFRLRPGRAIRLIPQCRGAVRPSRAINDVLFTAFGTPPKGMEVPNPGKLGQNHVLTHRLMSMDDNVAIMSADGRLHSVEQFRLRLTDAQRQRILSEAVGTGGEAGLTRMFNLVTASCVTEALAVLDRSLDYNPLNRLGALVFARNPRWIPFYLRMRGLAGAEDELPNLREEFPDR